MADDSLSASSHRRPDPARRLLHRWFFSTDRRYAMFQTIVGGTAANLIAAGIIAGIAVAAGALHVSVSWSWAAYGHIVAFFGVIGLVYSAVGLVINFVDMRRGETFRPWRRAIFWAIESGLTLIVLFPLVFNFI